MLEVKLNGFIDEGYETLRSEDGIGWCNMRALDLEDTSNGAQVAEWFYVAACNQYYYDIIAKKDKGGVGYYVQDNFDESALFNAVQKDFQKLEFEDWDDFYEKMQTVADREDD